MGDDDDGLAAQGLLLEKLQDRDTCRGIQGSGRLIAQQHRGVLGDRAGDGYSLLLSAGELVRELVHVLFQPDSLQGGCRIQRVLRQVRHQAHIFKDRQCRQDVVKLENETDIGRAVVGEFIFRVTGDIRPVRNDGALRRGVHAADQVQKGGLAGAGRSQDDDQFAGFNIKIHTIERFEGTPACRIRLAHISQ